MKKRYSAFFFLFVLLSPFISEACEREIAFVEMETRIIRGKLIPEGKVLFARPITDNLGAFMFFHGDGNPEGYIGPSFFFGPCLKIGIGIGLQKTERNPIRYGNFFQFERGNYSTFGRLEAGGDGFFTKLELNRRIESWYGVGFLYETNLGIGPRIQFNPFQSGFWRGIEIAIAGPLFNPGSSYQGAIMEISYHF